MTNSQRLATVRARFLSWLADQVQDQGKAADGLPRIVRETILIRDEFYCGRRLLAPDHQAVWFIEEDELKIYHNSGELACVLSGDQIDLAQPEDRAEPGTELAPDVIKLPAPIARDDFSGGQNSRAA